MVPAIFRPAAREDGVWGILAAAGSAAVLLAALALALDFSAAASARSDAQFALDSALRSAAHALAPDSVASGSPGLERQGAVDAADAVLAASLPGPLRFAWSSPPVVEAGPPAAIAATLSVTVPMPAVLGTVTFPVHSEEAIGWLPH